MISATLSESKVRSRRRSRSAERMRSRRSAPVCWGSSRRAFTRRSVPYRWSGLGDQTDCMVAVMRYVTFGRTGLRVSELALGAMTFGEQGGVGAPIEECRRMLDAYVEAG